MYKNTTLLILSFFQAVQLSAQSVALRGTIPGLGGDDVYLIRSFAGPQKIVDTARVNPVGTFTFDMKDQPVGMYKVMTNTGMAVKLLFDKHSVDFKTSGFQQGSKVEIIHSDENKIFYQYLNVVDENSNKLSLLEPVIQYYPPSDPFWQTVKNKAELLQNEIQKTASNLVTQYPNTMAAQFIQLDRPLNLPVTLTQDQKTSMEKQQYFKFVDFKDTLLLNTDLFTKKIVGYLSLYQKQGMTKDEVEEAFMPAVDTLLNKSLQNEKMYLFTMHYLIGGFEEFGFQKLLLHIAQSSKLNVFSKNTPLKAELQQKVYEIIHLAPGQPAPDFKARAIGGREINLYNIKAKKTLLVFWASWCPHCTAALPGLEKYYDPKNTENLQIIAISVDTDKKSVEKAVKDEGYKWPVIAQLQGWDSPIAVTYGISATPTFYLLDQDKRIIVKTEDVKTLEQYLKK
ncbi:MAG: redoxin domain-containing protein [Bacteroidales bacterium]|nr:redoxin domain-containing protein [Bacteroidales bacterium]